MHKILLLTSGGDCPGMNAAIRSVVRSAYYHGLTPVACRQGFQGLVDQQLQELTTQDVANRIQHGGTFLQLARCPAFLEAKTRATCLQFLQRQDTQGIIVIGGNGSLQAAACLAQESHFNIVGIPASIDNDIPGTSYAIGFDSACNTALAAIDKIRDTASSHNRHFIVEVMGREAGFLAAKVGLACGAEHIITPEFPMTAKQLAKALQQPKRQKQSCIIIVAESGQPGHSVALQQTLEQITTLSIRVCILGHLQRGGAPSAYDRCIASELGAVAIQMLVQKTTGVMTAVNQGSVQQVPLPQATNPQRLLSNDHLLALTQQLAL